MVYNTISDIKSRILEPFRMCGRFSDDFEVTVVATMRAIV